MDNRSLDARKVLIFTMKKHGSMSNNIRVEEWDILKGFAIFLVVWGHLNTNIIISDLISVVHMPLFFVASGYFAYQSFEKYTLKKIFLKKCKTLLIPFLAWSTVAFVMNCIKHFITNGLDRDYLLLKAIAVYVRPMSVWFLWALFIVFILFLCAFWLSKNIGNVGYIIIGGMWSVLIICFEIDILALNRTAVNYWWFVLGYFIRYIDLNKIRTNKLCRLSVLYIPLYFLVFKIISAEEFYMYYFLEFSNKENVLMNMGITLVSSCYTILGMLFVYCWIVPSLEKSLVKNIFVDLGKQSLDIYTIHMMFVSYIVFVPQNIKDNHLICNILYYPIYAFIICIVVNWIAKKILHNIKCYNIIMLGKF